MDHKPIPGQGIHPRFFYDRTYFFISLLRYQKPFHPDHGTAHKGIFIIPCHRQADRSFTSGYGKGNRVARFQIHHGFHGRGNIHFLFPDFFWSLPVSGKVILKKAIPAARKRPGNHLPLAVRFHTVCLIFGKNQPLSLRRLYTLLFPDAFHQKLYIRHIRCPCGKVSKAHPLHLIPYIAVSCQDRHQHGCQRKRCQKQKDSDLQKTSLISFHPCPDYHSIFQHFSLLSVCLSLEERMLFCVLPEMT